MARKIVDERDARTCLRAARASGQDRVEWARAHGVDARSLNAWRLNLGRGSAKKAPVARAASVARADLRLVELIPTSMPRAEGRYVVHVAGAEIAVDDDFREETLARIVRALRAC